MTSQPTRSQQLAQLQAVRRARILTAWLAGHSTHAIAQELGARPATVARIVRDNPAVAAERARRDTRERRRLTREAEAWSRAHPGRPLDEAATALGVSPARVREVLGERASLHPAQDPSRPARITDEDILHALQLFAKGGDLRMSTYRAVSAEQGWPSVSTVVQRHGCWRAALTAAGVQVPPPVARCARSEEELWRWVERYLATPGPWTLAGLGTWLATQDGAPSLSLVRQRLGGWHHILEGLAERASDTRAPQAAGQHST